jgi:hypothetical protein
MGLQDYDLVRVEVSQTHLNLLVFVMRQRQMTRNKTKEKTNARTRIRAHGHTYAHTYAHTW